MTSTLPSKRSHKLTRPKWPINCWTTPHVKKEAGLRPLRQIGYSYEHTTHSSYVYINLIYTYSTTQLFTRNKAEHNATCSGYKNVYIRNQSDLDLYPYRQNIFALLYVVAFLLLLRTLYIRNRCALPLPIMHYNISVEPLKYVSDR
jgi:hypothetical protein